MRGELRLHHGVARLPAELDRIHVLDAAIRGQRHDDDVRDREEEHDERRTAVDRIVQIEPRPVRRRRRAPLAPAAALEPGADRHQRQPDEKDGGQDEEKHEADIGIRMEAEQIGKKDDEKQHGADGGQRRAGERQQWRGGRTVTRAVYFFNVARYATSASTSSFGSVYDFITGFRGGLGPGGHAFRVDDPLADVAVRELAADLVQRTFLVAFHTDRMAHRALLIGVHLLARSLRIRRRG